MNQKLWVSYPRENMPMHRHKPHTHWLSFSVCLICHCDSDTTSYFGVGLEFTYRNPCSMQRLLNVKSCRHDNEYTYRVSELKLVLGFWTVAVMYL